VIRRVDRLYYNKGVDSEKVANGPKDTSEKLQQKKMLRRDEKNKRKKVRNAEKGRRKKLKSKVEIQVVEKTITYVYYDYDDDDFY